MGAIVMMASFFIDGMSKYKNIVWDWNGTLLDDLDTGLEVLNVMLSRRNLPLLSLEQYRKVFGFPVSDFYLKVGFDFQKESFEEMSEEFVEVYTACSEGKLRLNAGVRETLNFLSASGYGSYILTALKTDFLKQLLESFGISGYFKAVYGSDNIYAAGKIQRGREMVKECHIQPSETLMVGDTVHDAEVAAALGFESVLYLGGHNDGKRLRACSKVIDNISEIKGEFI